MNLFTLLETEINSSINKHRKSEGYGIELG